MSTNPKRTKKCLKISCVAAAIVLTVTSAVLAALFFTVLKPKQPIITARPMGLDKLAFNFTDIPTNVTIGFLITVKNRNYGSFRFGNATSSVDYRNLTVIEVPIEARRVPARGEINITASAVLMVSKLISSPDFIGDFVAGSLNMSSAATLPGKVSFLNFIKLDATAYNACNISFFVKTKDVVTNCVSKIKL